MLFKVSIKGKGQRDAEPLHYNKAQSIGKRVELVLILGKNDTGLGLVVGGYRNNSSAASFDISEQSKGKLWIPAAADDKSMEFSQNVEGCEEPDSLAFEVGQDSKGYIMVFIVLSRSTIVTRGVNEYPVAMIAGGSAH